MGRKKTPGLYKRGQFWHIDKQVYGCRLRESTGAVELTAAEAILAKRVEDLRQAIIFGVRPKRTFRQAATKYLLENQHKASIRSDVHRIKTLDKYIGQMTLDSLHMGSLQTFINARRADGVKSRTINHGLKVVRRILNLAATEWIDEQGLTWILQAPKISLIPEHDLRKPNPISWEEQQQFFQALPPHLARMALFAVNTGCRDQEICGLRWDWELDVEELQTSVFLIPSEHVKNREDRLVVLNDIATSVIAEVRGENDTYVFTYRGKPIKRMLNSGWKRAREIVDIDFRVHDLKHTFGRRLRSAGVSFEDRQDLLGHKSGRITTHYSAAELQNLIKAANTVCRKNENQPKLMLLKPKSLASPHNIPTMDFVSSKKMDLSV